MKNFNDKTLSNLFSMNRDEEELDDLWGIYVLPTNYPQYNLLNYEKSIHITGGRGIGKTAYLKYHCYPTILSDKKTKISHDDLKRVGIYIRLDSELLADMSENVISKEWSNAFNAYIGLSILIELSKFLKKFSTSQNIESIYKDQVKQLTLPKKLLSFLNLKHDLPFVSLAEEGDYLRADFIDWLCDTEQNMPFKFKAKEKINLFIKQIQNIDFFHNIKFIIFIDEFENLYPEHQRIINTWIKHVPENMIFHIAYKKYYTPESNTIGQEQNQVNNDYRVISLEDDVYGESKFSLLASEIVLSKLHKYFDQPFKILNINDQNYLSNQAYLANRNEEQYIKKITKYMFQMFPTCSLKDASISLIQDSLLLKKLKNTIASALKNKKSSLSSELFFDKDKPEESILNAVLLHRERIDPKILLQYFQNNLKEYSKWKNNNLLGALLFIYNKELYNRKCPYYAGFDHFIQQSSYNLRHLLELIHQSFIYAEKNGLFFSSIEEISFDIKTQTDVVRHVSTNEINNKIAYLGNYGKKLKKITERLGKLFALFHNNPAQSFAEVNQFAIKTSLNDINLEEHEEKAIDTLISELLMWSILIEYDNTKKWKKTDNNSLKEYRLHPILSSYFGLSFRKKRKIDFTMDEFKTIFIGSNNEYEGLYNKYWEKNIAQDDENTDKKPIYEQSLLDLIK